MFEYSDNYSTRLESLSNYYIDKINDDKNENDDNGNKINTTKITTGNCSNICVKYYLCKYF